MSSLDHFYYSSISSGSAEDCFIHSSFSASSSLPNLQGFSEYQLTSEPLDVLSFSPTLSSDSILQVPTLATALLTSSTKSASSPSLSSLSKETSSLSFPSATITSTTSSVITKTNPSSTYTNHGPDSFLLEKPWDSVPSSLSKTHDSLDSYSTSSCLSPILSFSNSPTSARFTSFSDPEASNLVKASLFPLPSTQNVSADMLPNPPTTSLGNQPSHHPIFSISSSPALEHGSTKQSSFINNPTTAANPSLEYASNSTVLSFEEIVSSNNNNQSGNAPASLASSSPLSDLSLDKDYLFTRASLSPIFSNSPQFLPFQDPSCYNTIPDYESRIPLPPFPHSKLHQFINKETWEKKLRDTMRLYLLQRKEAVLGESKLDKTRRSDSNRILFLKLLGVSKIHHHKAQSLEVLDLITYMRNSERELKAIKENNYIKPRPFPSLKANVQEMKKKEKISQLPPTTLMESTESAALVSQESLSSSSSTSTSTTTSSDSPFIFSTPTPSSIEKWYHLSSMDSSSFSDQQYLQTSTGYFPAMAVLRGLVPSEKTSSTFHSSFISNSSSYSADRFQVQTPLSSPHKGVPLTLSDANAPKPPPPCNSFTTATDSPSAPPSLQKAKSSKKRKKSQGASHSTATDPSSTSPSHPYSVEKRAPGMKKEALSKSTRQGCIAHRMVSSWTNRSTSPAGCEMGGVPRDRAMYQAQDQPSTSSTWSSSMSLFPAPAPAPPAPLSSSSSSSTSSTSSTSSSAHSPTSSCYCYIGLPNFHLPSSTSTTPPRHTVLRHPPPSTSTVHYPPRTFTACPTPSPHLQPTAPGAALFPDVVTAATYRTFCATCVSVEVSVMWGLARVEFGHGQSKVFFASPTYVVVWQGQVRFVEKKVARARGQVHVYVPIGVRLEGVGVGGEVFFDFGVHETVRIPEQWLYRSVPPNRSQNMTHFY